MPERAFSPCSARSPKRAAVLALLCLAACSDEGPPSVVESARFSCATQFRYVPSGPVGFVQLAGSWNGFALDTHPMDGPDAGGAYTASTTLPAGFHAYKFVVDGEWILDPAHRLRAWSGGIENSGVRVADCERPRLALVDHREDDAHSFLFRTFAPPEGSAAVTPTATLETAGRSSPLAVVATAEPGTWTVSTGPLPDGKHRVRIQAEDADGRGAEPLILPFWVEPRRWDWRDASIYMLMTDRFFDGDPTNNEGDSGSSAANGRWEGGDLWGVADAIDAGWFDALGVTALWLTPWNTNAAGAWAASDGVHQVTGFHGYWPIAPRTVDPRLGGEDALDAVVRAAHDRGIRVLMDLVLNHVHEGHPYVAEHPEWFARVDDGGCVCGTDGCDWTSRRLDCLFTPYLPDVRWEDPRAAEQLVDDALFWLDRFDLDGFRVDAVKHVPDSAIFHLAIRARERFEGAGTPLFLMGETAMGWSDCHPEDPACNAENYDTISRYLGPDALDGQFDFVLHHAAALRSFATDERGMIHTRTWTEASQRRYPPDAVMTPYIGSHDTARFLTVASQPERAGAKWPEELLPTRPEDEAPYRRLGLALTWNLTIPGAPLLYSGDEYGEWGGSDPDNRHAVRAEETWTEHEQMLHSWVSAVGRARRDEPALRRGDLLTLFNDEDLWAYARNDAESGRSAIVVLNAGAAPRQGVELYLPPSVFIDDGTILEDALDGTTFVAEAGLLRIDVDAATARVLLPPE